MCEIDVSPFCVTEIDIAPDVAGLPMHDPLAYSDDVVASRLIRKADNGLKPIKSNGSFSNPMSACS